MKVLVVLASLALAISAATDQELWSQFKKQHGKVYRSLREEKLRYKTFQQTLRKIEAHNALYESGKKTYFLGINKFADLSPEEFKSKYLTFKKAPIKTNNKFVKNATLKLSESIDWRDQGAVLEVKDQGDCGGCWAFSATGSMEGQNAIKYGKKISLSEQELIDCTTEYGNEGCDGGYMEYGFEYVQENGISTESSYPYTAEDGWCSEGEQADIQVSGFTEVDDDEESLQQAVASIGPISVAIYADDISYYAGGVFNECSSDEVDHGVLAVGYGSEDGQDYWLIKNSWGSDWGEAGYFKLVRNEYQQCGIGSWSVYPNIN